MNVATPPHKASASGSGEEEGSAPPTWGKVGSFWRQALPVLAQEEGSAPTPWGKVGSFCCQALPGPRLTLLRRQGFKVELDRTALRGQGVLLSEVIVRS